MATIEIFDGLQMFDLRRRQLSAFEWEDDCVCLRQGKLQHPSTCNSFFLHEQLNGVMYVSIQELPYSLSATNKMPLTQVYFVTVERRYFSPLVNIPSRYC